MSVCCVFTVKVTIELKINSLSNELETNIFSFAVSPMNLYGSQVLYMIHKHSDEYACSCQRFPFSDAVNFQSQTIPEALLNFIFRWILEQAIRKDKRKTAKDYSTFQKTHRGPQEMTAQQIYTLLCIWVLESHHCQSSNACRTNERRSYPWINC